jgi:hypothetical protein
VPEAGGEKEVFGGELRHFVALRHPVEGAAIHLQISRFPLPYWKGARGIGKVTLTNYSSLGFLTK